MQFNLAVHCPNQRDSTSLYRAAGPFSVLRQQNPNLHICYLPQHIDWSHLAMVDAIFMQRPFRPADIQLAEIAERLGKPVWVDFDDDLLNVPSWNPTSKIYNNRNIQENVAIAVKMATVVSVSTRFLADLLGPLNENMVVIPNAWNDVFYPRHDREKDHAPGEMLVMWRGSETHRNDLNVAADACIDLAKEFPHVTWFFLGDAPWFVDYMPSHAVRVAEAIDPMEYHALIHELQPNVWIVPLEDCKFNHSKSNCSWIEASWAGAATLAPTWDEWRRPGIVNYRNGKDFAVKLRNMLQLKPAALDECAQKSWHYLSEMLPLTKVNEKRQAILEGLANEIKRRTANTIQPA